jgi:hypothetical protein
MTLAVSMEAVHVTLALRRDARRRTPRGTPLAL